MLLVTIVEIIQFLLDVLWYIIIVQWVLSLLVIFNVINTHSPFVRQLLSALDQITAPIYAPIRRIMPDFGGIDFSPAVVLLLIGLLERIILPNLLMSAQAHGAL